MESTNSKKRKREAHQDEEITLSISTAPSTVGPVIVAFPALQPKHSTAFTCYVKHQNASSVDAIGQMFSTQRSFIVGETDTVEFHTADVDRQNSASQYLIGVHDRTTNRVTLRHAPLHILAREVKAFKSLDPLAADPPSDERERARNVLGEAFGSKKAKQAIRAMERNRVDVSAMEAVADHLQDSIDAGTIGLPSQEAAQAASNENRPIPRFNAQAESPDEVYGLHDIVTEAELNSIRVKELMSSADEMSRKACLPYQRSTWINEHLAAEFTTAKPSKTNLKILFYISAMFLFRNGSVSDKAQLQKRMASVPNEVVDGLLARFTERTRGSTEIQVTKQAQTLLLTYMFALCLRLDRYATDPTHIAADLRMSVPTVIKHFKQLGCKVDILTPTERIRVGLGPTNDKGPKRCVLRVPLDFPNERAHKRK